MDLLVRRATAGPAVQPVVRKAEMLAVATDRQSESVFRSASKA
jgi:hypothetical protein